MEYRGLGKTGLMVSAIGLGAAMLGSSETDYAVKVVERAMRLGVNYFDTARSYWDSEVKIGLALKDHRKQVYLSSKTGAKTREEAWKHIKESLARLQSDYVDNYHLHGLRDEDDLRQRTGPGGALEALIEARDKGLIHHIGCTSHRSEVLVRALERFNFETILVPMNIVEREPLDRLIPLCQSRGVGVTIMKPVATGLLPARLALKWLLGQPISTAVPGATTVEDIEEDASVGHLGDFTLSAEEKADVDLLARELEHVRCRICGECEPCPAGIPIASTLGTDVIYDHYRTMGPDGFARFPWSPERVAAHVGPQRQRIAQIRSCTDCGQCEERCPSGLPVTRMLKTMVEPMENILKIWKERYGI